MVECIFCIIFYAKFLLNPFKSVVVIKHLYNVSFTDTAEVLDSDAFLCVGESNMKCDTTVVHSEEVSSEVFLSLHVASCT